MEIDVSSWPCYRQYKQTAIMDSASKVTVQTFKGIITGKHLRIHKIFLIREFGRTIMGVVT
jgi:hypothetical protein